MPCEDIIIFWNVCMLTEHNKEIWKYLPASPQIYLVKVPVIMTA
jgi:hypothetical protein